MKAKNKSLPLILSVSAAIFVLVVAPVLIKAYVANNYHIPSGAMINTIQIGDHVWCNRLTYLKQTPARGDVVVFPYPKDPSVSYIKRVIGLEGEVLEIKNKKVFINGEQLNEPYAFIDTEIILPQSPRDNFSQVKIPDGKLFVMGDNRDNSLDSRFWGFVDSEDVECKTEHIYWSWNSDKSSVRWDRIGKKVE